MFVLGSARQQQRKYRHVESADVALLACKRQKRTVSLILAHNLAEEVFWDHSRVPFLLKVNFIAAALVFVKHLSSVDVLDQVPAHNAQLTPMLAQWGNPEEAFCKTSIVLVLAAPSGIPSAERLVTCQRQGLTHVHAIRASLLIQRMEGLTLAL